MHTKPPQQATNRNATHTKRKKNKPTPHTSVIYRFAVSWGACEASCYLYTALIWVLDQLLMTLVSERWQIGTGTAGL